MGTSDTSAAAAVSSQPPAASGSATSSYLMAQMPKSEKKPVLRPAVFDKVINFLTITKMAESISELFFLPSNNRIWPP